VRKSLPPCLSPVCDARCGSATAGIDTSGVARHRRSSGPAEEGRQFRPGFACAETSGFLHTLTPSATRTASLVPPLAEAESTQPPSLPLVQLVRDGRQPDIGMPSLRRTAAVFSTRAPVGYGPSRGAVDSHPIWPCERVAVAIFPGNCKGQNRLQTRLTMLLLISPGVAGRIHALTGSRHWGGDASTCRIRRFN
jgi:hypothetical protein